MTAMKYSVYALVAVVFGVVLVGLLPGQLSNMAAPANQKSPLQGIESSGGGTLGTGGSYPSRYNDSVGNQTSSWVSNETVTTTGSTAGIPAKVVPSGSGAIGEASSNAYTDLTYYGMMIVGLVVALGVYFISRRMLG